VIGKCKDDDNFGVLGRLPELSGEEGSQCEGSRERCKDMHMHDVEPAADVNTMGNERIGRQVVAMMLVMFREVTTLRRRKPA
jgi:hypothetical protein